MRIVMDSNVIIAAYAGRAGLCHDIFRYCIENHKLFLSHYILNEIKTNLSKKIKLPDILIQRVVDVLDSAAEIIDPPKSEPHRCRDDGDLPILYLATAVKADYLISGDNDLLVLKKANRALIVSPREFWNKVIVSSRKHMKEK